MRSCRPGGNTAPARQPAAGFTLVEVLVAMAVFALVGIAAVQLLHFAIDAEARSSVRAARFEAVQRTMQLLERDLLQAVPRSVRGSNGETLPPLLGGVAGGLEFTRQGWRNPLGLRRSSLQRVAWSLSGTDLIRSWWPNVDRADDDQPRGQLVLPEVEALELSFVDAAGESHATWPPLDGAAAGALLADALDGEAGSPAVIAGAQPVAVEVRLVVAPYGELRRLWPLVQVSAAAVAGGQPDAGSNGNGDLDPGDNSDADSLDPGGAGGDEADAGPNGARQ